MKKHHYLSMYLGAGVVYAGYKFYQAPPGTALGVADLQKVALWPLYLLNVMS